MARNNAVRKRWQAQAEERLPQLDTVCERNAAVTATYAWLYLQRPRLFKWAGIAAFASHRVGLALTPYDSGPIVASLTQGLRGITSWCSSRSTGALEADLELIRQTNNRVFADMAWAHLAYLTPDAGLAAIEAGLADLPNHADMLEGFRRIAHAESWLRAGRRGREDALAAIWEGNQLLLKHEQNVTVQPAFADLQPGMDRFLSLMTWMDFDPLSVLPYPTGWENLQRAWSLLAQIVWLGDFHPDSTSFYVYMLTRGLGTLLQTRSVPDIRRFDHRWSWIEHQVMPLWRHVDTADPTVRWKMRQLSFRAECTGRRRERTNHHP